MIDSGASLNLIDYPTYEQLRKPELTETKVKIYPYQTKKSLIVKGFFTTEFIANQNSTTDRVYVIQGTASSILSKSTAEKLD